MGFDITARTWRLGLTATALATILAGPAWAQMPSGLSVSAGGATESQTGANALTIRQATERAVLNWQSFSIGPNGSVQFVQPNSAAIALNRVTGGSISDIQGILSGNGQVWIINPAGVMFGRNASVNVAGLVATTGDMSDQAFMSGGSSFALATPSAGLGSTVANEGSINVAPGGSAVLSADHVVNGGTIAARLGKVVLGASDAFTVDFDGDKLLTYQITAPVSTPAKGAKALVANLGTISAEGGEVLLTARAARSVATNVINTTGMISATTASSVDGMIVLDAGPGGTANVNGTLSVAGAGVGQTGGTVELLGDNIALGPNAVIDASGSAGGGSVLIGGNEHGTGPLTDSLTVAMADGATINASATQSGNGGTVVLWSNDGTNFAGAITVTGGVSGGNGGFVETSSPSGLAISGTVDALAPAGAVGTWLMDPGDIDIVQGGSGTLSGATGFTGGVLMLAPQAIDTAEANVVLEASKDITFESIVAMQNPGVSLTAIAGGNINVNQGAIITTFNGAITLAANSGPSPTGTGSINLDGPLSTAVFGATGAGVTLSAGAGGQINLGAMTIAGAAITTANAPITFEGQTVVWSNVFLDTSHATLVAPSTVAFEGPVTFIGSGITTVGSQVYTGEIDITGSTTLTAYGVGSATSDVIFGPNVRLASAVDPDDGGDGAVITFASIPPTSVDTIVGDGFPLEGNQAFTVAASGNILVEGQLQNGGTGNVTLIAGWDNETNPAVAATTPGAFGNFGGSIGIGGPDATGLAAVGSLGGTTTLAGANLAIEGVNGPAQLGLNGSNASGNIVVNLTGTLGLLGGATTGTYAQIGNGGGGTTGNEAGNITINANGDIGLEGGGELSYAQIGNGGALSNYAATQGFSDVGNIAIVGDDIALSGGTGGASYAQIGNGGYEAGYGATVGAGAIAYTGRIQVTAGGTLSLAGLGADAYAQIGNGGEGSNVLASGSTITDSGDILVTTGTASSDGQLRITGDSYAQIGNGGYGDNEGASAPGGISESGNISVTINGDSGAVLAGGSSGPFAYAQVGNGDAGGAGFGNVSGNMDISAPSWSLVPGSAAVAWMWNATGNGTVSGTTLLDGAVTLPGNIAAIGPVIDPAALNAADTSDIARTPDPTDEAIDGLLSSLSSDANNIILSSLSGGSSGGGSGGSGGGGSSGSASDSNEGPIEAMTSHTGAGGGAGNGGSDGSASDGSSGAAAATDFGPGQEARDLSSSIALSLNGNNLPGSNTQSCTQLGSGAAVLCEVSPASTARGTPQAEQPVELLYSNWGNEALWQ